MPLQVDGDDPPVLREGREVRPEHLDPADTTVKEYERRPLPFRSVRLVIDLEAVDDGEVARFLSGHGCGNRGEQDGRENRIPHGACPLGCGYHWCEAA